MNAINILQQVSLRDYSTMRLGGTAAYLTHVHSRQELLDALDWAGEQSLPVLMIGSGSNIVWRDEGFSGLVLVNEIEGYEQKEDGDDLYLTVGGGENWDRVVERSVQAGAVGIECLSLIPGTAGATPVQNVGAYGQEIAQTLVSLEAYDRQTRAFVQIPGAECGFGYRRSRFNTHDKGRFLITAITLRLSRKAPEPPFYPALGKYLEEHGISRPTAQQVRDAVIAIRMAKLPDPARVPNNGSFFGNPVIPAAQADRLLAEFPQMPHWPTTEGDVKVAAAWLIERAGFKGVHDSETGMATWQAQPLVIINEKAGSTADLLRFRQKIQDAVYRQFGITLVQEPELLP